MARQRLGEILIKAGLIDEAGLQRALAEQQRWGGRLGKYLVELGLITEETLVRALSTQYRLPAVALDAPRMNVTVARLIPKEVCERHQLMCFRADPSKKFIDVAMADPADRDVIDQVQAITRCTVRPHIASPSAIDRAIMYVFYGQASMGAGEVDFSDAIVRNDFHAHPGTARSGVPPGGAASGGRVPRGLVSGAPMASPMVEVRVSAQSRPEAAPGAAPISLPRDVMPAAAPSPPMPLPRSEPRPPPQAPLTLPRASAPLIAVDGTLESKPLSLSTPPGDPGFHITLDVPPVDKAKLAGGGVAAMEERVAHLEAVVARDTVILEALLGALVKKGLFTREELQRLIGAL